MYPVWENKDEDPKNPDKNPDHYRKNSWGRIQCYFCNRVYSWQGSNFKKHLKTHLDSIGKEHDEDRWYKFHVATGVAYNKFVPPELYQPQKDYNNVPSNPNYDETKSTITNPTDRVEPETPTVKSASGTHSKIATSSKGFLPKIDITNKIPMDLSKLPYDQDWGDIEDYILQQTILTMNDLGANPSRIQNSEQFGRYCSVCSIFYYYIFIFV